MKSLLVLIQSCVEQTKHGPKSLYKCSCGNKKIILDNNVRYKKTLSCGCLQKIRASISNTKHGAVATRAYGIWAGMRGRCLVKSHSSYHRYGGSGITICDEWSDFKKFLEDMGPPEPGQTLDRIDGAKGYYKNNCRWATYSVQAQNTGKFRANSTGRKGISYRSDRKKYCARITINGKTIFLGHYVLFDQALLAREEAEKKYFSI